MIFVVYVNDILRLYDDESLAMEVAGTDGKKFDIRQDWRIENFLCFSIAN